MSRFKIISTNFQNFSLAIPYFYNVTALIIEENAEKCCHWILKRRVIRKTKYGIIIKCHLVR